MSILDELDKRPCSEKWNPKKQRFVKVLVSLRSVSPRSAFLKAGIMVVFNFAEDDNVIDYVAYTSDAFDHLLDEMVEYVRCRRSSVYIFSNKHV